MEAIEKGLEERLESSNMPYYILQVRIVDENNQDVGIRKTGERMI
jgi:hypothetical protein